MTPTTTAMRRRALNCIVLATLAVAFVVPTASAAPPPTAGQTADAQSNVMKTRHETVKNSINNVR